MKDKIEYPKTYEKDLIKQLGFSPKENESGLFSKKYTNGYIIGIDFNKNIINYGKDIKCNSKTTQNFSQAENFVVLECVNRLLEKGYKPNNIILEKTYPSGHGTSGRLDICVTRDDGSEYLLIECKMYGKEFDKEFARMKKDGGQLFTYFKFSDKPDIIMLYASELKGKEIIYRNEIVKIENDYRIGDVKDFYEKWNKLTKDNGVFDAWVKPYNFESRALTIYDLVEIRQEDSGFIFNQFLEILRHNVVSDKPNAFNKIFTLFLCKIYDERINEETQNKLGFQWLEGVDDDVSFQLRLTDLYKEGMAEFLEKKVTDFSEDEFDTRYQQLFSSNDSLARELKQEINRIRLEKNNEFAIREVYDRKSFVENAKVVKEVVELLQKYKIRYTKKHQYLSDFFELLLTTGLKQESGQFFTPVPVAQFIIKSLPIDDFINKKLLMGKKDDMLPHIIDYAAGSGHFITECMHELQNILAKYKPGDFSGETKRFIKKTQDYPYEWAFNYVYGIEKDYRLVKVGKVGCYLHGDGLANVIHSDGLACFNYPEYKGLLVKRNKNFPKENNNFDIIISNPPYSVSAFKNAAREYYTDKDFELYKYLTDNSSEIECLFVERMKQLLKDGGVAGIILPSSILSNEGIYTKTREIILKYFEIISIAELGSNTFMATGTNTVILFLRRRNNYDCQNIAAGIENLFKVYQDNTINGIEKPITKYIKHVWENISFTDYVSLQKKEPDSAVINHEIYKEYRKNLKVKAEKDFWNILLETEKEKLLYFILAYPKKVVLVKTGEKDTEKKFLGYEFSNRRGNEGIHPIQRGKSIGECTSLFDEEKYDNPQKASAYIYKAFNGDYNFLIHENLKDNISRVSLTDLLTFNRSNFEKSISTDGKKKVKFESKWEQILFTNAIKKIEGSTKKIEKYNIKKEGKYPVITQERENLISGYSDNNNPINDLPVLLFGDHSCTLKYLDFEFFRGADGTVLLKPQDYFNPKYFYNVLQYGLLDLVKTKEKYERHYKYLQNLYILLPSKEIQEIIVTEIEALENKENKMQENIEKLRKNINNILNTELKERHKIGTILTLEYGTGLSEGDRIPGEYPVVGSNGIIGYHSKYLVESPSIVVGRKGSAGKVTWVDKNCYPIDTTFYVKLINNQYNLKLIWYALQKLTLENLSGGTGVPGLNRNDVYSKIILLPLISEQQNIIYKIEKIEVQIQNLLKEFEQLSTQKELVLKKYL